MKKDFLKKINKKLAVLALIFVSAISISITYGWGSIWHDVNTWIGNGSIITSRDLAENLQYLYDRISDDIECPQGSMLRYNQSLDKYECFRCPVGSAIKWINGKASCEQ